MYVCHSLSHTSTCLIPNIHLPVFSWSTRSSIDSCHWQSIRFGLCLAQKSLVLSYTEHKHTLLLYSLCHHRLSHNPAVIVGEVIRKKYKNIYLLYVKIISYDFPLISQTLLTFLLSSPLNTTHINSVLARDSFETLFDPTNYEILEASSCSPPNESWAAGAGLRNDIFNPIGTWWIWPR